MQRALLVMNLLLALTLGALWQLDASLEERFEKERRAASRFLSLPATRGALVGGVARLELTLPGSPTTWVYTREKDGWRLPEYRGAFALGRELEAVLKALLEQKGTMVGSVPADETHFALEPAEALRANLFDRAGESLLSARVGRVAPGKRSGESFMTAEGSDVILHMNANAWSPIQWRPGGSFPPLLDRRVTPLALGRRSIAKISVGGRMGEDGGGGEIVRREVQEDPRLARQSGPSYEWHGKLGQHEEKRLNDRAAFAYVGSLSGLEFDAFVGSRAQAPGGFERPSLIVTLSYDGDATDTLTLGGPTERGLYRLHHSATDQVFLISRAKANALKPNVEALLQPVPEAPVPRKPPGVR